MNGKKQFIILGNIRIRVSNIKSYGISSEERFYEKIYIGIEVSHSRSGLPKLLLGEKYTTLELEWKGDMELIDDDRYSDISKKNYYECDEEYRRCGCKSMIYCNTYKLYKKTGSNEILESDQFSTIDEVVLERRDKYLYITTFQRDNYRFFEDEFNIFEKCRELDKLVNGN